MRGRPGLQWRDKKPRLGSIEEIAPGSRKERMKKYLLSLLTSEGLGVLSSYTESFLLVSMGGVEAFSPFFSFFTLKKVGLGGKGGSPEALLPIFVGAGTLSRPLLP